MTLLQNIETPYQTFKEQTTPSNPAAGDQRVFIDSADHKLKVVNSSGTVSSVGGGGTATYESAYASPPATPNAGDIWYITDSLLHARYTGSAWSYYYGTKKVTKPVLSNYSTWLNQGSATLNDYGHLVMACPATNTPFWHGAFKTVPGTPYIIDAIILPMANPRGDSTGVMIGWSNGSLAAGWGQSNVNTGTNLEGEIQKYTAGGGFSAFYGTFSRTFFNAQGSPLYLRITDDGGSNRTCAASFDGGMNYDTFHTIGHTDYLTPTLVGLILVTNNVTYAPSMSILSWYEH